jgi:hypothetical protein
MKEGHVERLIKSNQVWNSASTAAQKTSPTKVIIVEKGSMLSFSSNPGW